VWNCHLSWNGLGSELWLVPRPYATAGRQLPVRLMLYMRPKCHPLLLDATINSPFTVRLNIFQVGPPWCFWTNLTFTQKPYPETYTPTLCSIDGYQSRPWLAGLSIVLFHASYLALALPAKLLLAYWYLGSLSRLWYHGCLWKPLTGPPPHTWPLQVRVCTFVCDVCATGIHDGGNEAAQLCAGAGAAVCGAWGTRAKPCSASAPYIGCHLLCMCLHGRHSAQVRGRATIRICYSTLQQGSEHGNCLVDCANARSLLSCACGV